MSHKRPSGGCAAWRRRLSAPPLLAALACISLVWGLWTAPVSARPQNLRQLSEITNKLTETSVSYGAIPALYRPRYDRVQDADLNMSQEDVVFVVMLPGGPRIYPQRFMVWHQVVNELIDDVAYAVTYCPITGTLMAYNASMNGLNLIFDLEGRLYDGNSVLIDRNSGSLWLQETGMAFEGPLLGRGMPTIPVFWTTWGAARRVYPDAPVLAQPRGSRPYGRDPYGSYLKKNTYYDNDILVYPVQRLDRRFARKTPMLCLEYENFLLAVDIAYVKKKGAVNFFLGPSALLAVHDPRLDVVRVYNRQIWAEPFLFVSQYGRLVDINTRSVWDPATGKALDGNMRGASMKQYFGGYSMWFAWYSLNPETLVIPGPGEVPADLLSLTPPGMAVLHKLTAAGREVHVEKPGAEQHAKVIDAAQIGIGRHLSRQGRAQHGFPGQGGIIRQIQNHGGTVRAGTAQMFIHDPQNIQLVRVAHHMGGQFRFARQMRGQGKAVVQAHGGQHDLARGVGFPGQTRLAPEDFHAQQAVIAGFPVPEGMIEQILLKAGHVVIQRGQQAGTGQGGVKAFAGRYAAGVVQYGHGVPELEIHGRGVALFLGALSRGIGREPLFMRADIRIHDLGCTPGRPARQVRPVLSLRL